MALSMIVEPDDAVTGRLLGELGALELLRLAERDDAVPGLSALNAVADPAQTDYLYFLSGDDDVTYFGTTEAEHTANIRNHCQQKCLLP